MKSSDQVTEVTYHYDLQLKLWVVERWSGGTKLPGYDTVRSRGEAEALRKQILDHPHSTQA